MNYGFVYFKSINASWNKSLFFPTTCNLSLFLYTLVNFSFEGLLLRCHEDKIYNWLGRHSQSFHQDLISSSGYRRLSRLHENSFNLHLDSWSWGENSVLERLLSIHRASCYWSICGGLRLSSLIYKCSYFVRFLFYSSWRSTPLDFDQIKWTIHILKLREFSE